MRWQLAGPWPVGPAVIPAGTIITAVVGPDGGLVFDRTVRPPMPINAAALDHEAALQTCMWYEETDTVGGWHQLLFHPGIDREAIFAQARHKKRWPNGGADPSDGGLHPCSSRREAPGREASTASQVIADGPRAPLGLVRES